MNNEEKTYTVPKDPSSKAYILKALAANNIDAVPPGLILFDGFYADCKELTAEECGELIFALFAYQYEGEKPAADSPLMNERTLRVIYSHAVQVIDENVRKYRLQSTANAYAAYVRERKKYHEEPQDFWSWFASWLMRKKAQEQSPPTVCGLEKIESQTESAGLSDW